MNKRMILSVALAHADRLFPLGGSAYLIGCKLVSFFSAGCYNTFDDTFVDTVEDISKARTDAANVQAYRTALRKMLDAVPAE